MIFPEHPAGVFKGCKSKCSNGERLSYCGNLFTQTGNFGQTPRRSMWATKEAQRKLYTILKIKLYTFLLIINGLVLKNFTLSLPLYSFVVVGHEGTKSQRKLYTSVKNKTLHIFVDNQRFSAEKLYTFFTGCTILL